MRSWKPKLDRAMKQVKRACQTSTGVRFVLREEMLPQRRAGQSVRARRSRRYFLLSGWRQSVRVVNLNLEVTP